MLAAIFIDGGVTVVVNLGDFLVGARTLGDFFDGVLREGVCDLCTGFEGVPVCRLLLSLAGDPIAEALLSSDSTGLCGPEHLSVNGEGLEFSETSCALMFSLLCTFDGVIRVSGIGVFVFLISVGVFVWATVRFLGMFPAFIAKCVALD